MVILETDERYVAATTNYQAKHGVEKVGNKETYDAEWTDRGVKICSRSITTWYFKDKDKQPERLPGVGACVTVPDIFFAQLKDELKPPDDKSFEIMHKVPKEYLQR